MNESDSALENHSSDDEKTIVETTINIQHRKLNMSTSDPTRTKILNTKNSKLHLNCQKRLIKKKKNIQKWKKSDLCPVIKGNLWNANCKHHMVQKVQVRFRRRRLYF